MTERSDHERRSSAQRVPPDSRLCANIRTTEGGAGATARQLETLAAFLEDQGLNPNTHMTASNRL